MTQAAVRSALDNRVPEQDLESLSLGDAFLAWLERQASADSINVLLFVGIAGRKLRRLACEAKRSFPHSVYLPMNSAAILLAETHLATIVDDLRQLALKTHGHPIREFFERFEIPLPSRNFMSGIGLPDNTIVDRLTRNLFIRFLYAYRWEILKVCRQKRRELLQHLLQSGISNGMRVGIVDLGWEAESQLILSRTLEAMFDISTYAYCFCLTDDLESLNLRSAVRTHAMLSPDNYPDATVQLLFEQQATIEMWFADSLANIPATPSATALVSLLRYIRGAGAPV